MGWYKWTNRVRLIYELTKISWQKLAIIKIQSIFFSIFACFFENHIIYLNFLVILYLSSWLQQFISKSIYYSFFSFFCQLYILIGSKSG